jgi:hypothetical protein
VNLREVRVGMRVVEPHARQHTVYRVVSEPFDVNADRPASKRLAPRWRVRLVYPDGSETHRDVDVLAPFDW